METNFDGFYSTALGALIESGSYVRDAIVGTEDLVPHLVKGDKTAVTVVDEESQTRAIRFYREAGLLEVLDLNAEEDDGQIESGKRYVLYHDPLDGTSGFLIGGPNPTIISAIYDRQDSKFIAVATLEPVTGRFWYSEKGFPTTLEVVDLTSRERLIGPRNISVNQSEVNGGRVLVDVGHAFTRKLKSGGRKPILRQQERRALSNMIENIGSNEYFLNTNGGHYALVASGRPTLVGCVTTAIGGPFDIAGLLHVENAGGVVASYVIEEDGGGRSLRSQTNPHDVGEMDMVIAANNQDNLSQLEKVLRGVVEGT